MRARSVYLPASGSIDRCLLALDQAVVDVHVGTAYLDPDAACADVTVGDVQLATVLGAHGITIERQIAVVDLHHPRALAHDGLVTPLEWGTAPARLAGTRGTLRPCAHR